MCDFLATSSLLVIVQFLTRYESHTKYLCLPNPFCTAVIDGDKTS